MVFQNIEFHNVEELVQCHKGYAMLRIPTQLKALMNEELRDTTSRFTTGVELRFKIIGDSATIIIRGEEALEAQAAYVYYGAFQAGWQYSAKPIMDSDTRITIPKADNLDSLVRLSQEHKLGFNPEVVRIVLPYGTCYFVEVEGEVAPPGPGDTPQMTYLAYGSSITHGSLGLAAPYSYPFRIAQKLHCDYLNLGFAGTAHMEKEMAKYLISRKDWTFASVEMGINMLGFASEELFEDRIKSFVEVLATESRPIFAASIFGFNGGMQEKGQRFRDIVRKYADGKLIYTDGLALLNNPSYISQDDVHPSSEGLGEISMNWHRIMKEHLG